MKPVSARPSTKTTPASRPPAKTTAEPKDWTVLLYLDGDNNAEERITRALLMVERAVGTSAKVNIVAQLGRLPQEELKAILKDGYDATNIDGDWSGTRRFLVTKQTPQESEDNQIKSHCFATLEPETHMSDATALVDAMVDTVKRYPAKNYAVFCADHGGSFEGAMESDDTPNGSTVMTPPQIEKALDLVEKTTGARPAVIDMAACLMADAETAYQVRDHGTFYLGSQETTSKTYQSFGPILADLVKASDAGKPMTPKELSMRILHEYDDKPDVAPDKSLIKLSAMSGVKDAMTGLVAALRKTKIAPREIADAFEDAQHFLLGEDADQPYANTRDLQGMADNLAQLAGKHHDRALEKAATAMSSAVKAAVVDNHASDYQHPEIVAEGRSSDGKEKTTTIVLHEGHYDAHGLSVFAPTSSLGQSQEDFNKFMDQSYNYLAFPRETGWGDWLKDFNASLAADK